MAQNKELPFGVGSALGHTGASTLHKFGYNADIGTSAETVWDEGGLYAYPAAAGTLKVSSSSANDDVGGTGALTVQVYGVDGSYNEVNETITLTGQTAVTTTNSYLRVYRAIVRTAGSGETNDGDIYVGTGTVTAGVPATVYLKVMAGNAQTLMSLWTVPAGKKLVMTGVLFSTARTANVTCKIVARPENEVFQLKEQFLIYQGTLDLAYDPPLVFDEKTDIELRAFGASGTSDVSAAFSGYYVSRL